MFGRGIITFLTAVKVSFVFGLLIFVFGCSSDLGLNPELKTSTATNVVSTSTDDGRGVPESALKFIELPQVRNGSQTIAGGYTYVEEVVTREKGGELQLNYCYQPSTINNEVCIKSELKVPPYAVSSDILMSMNLSSDNLTTDVDLVFGPHGTVFEKPVTLIYKVTGLYLSDNEDDYDDDDDEKGQGGLGFYYYNEETGLWEWIYAQIEIDDNYIKVKAKLVHFSRYSFSRFPLSARYALAISR